MNDLQIFNHQKFGKVRWVDVNGKPGAVGVDIARALEYANPSKAVIDHCKGITKLGIPSEGGNQETNIIPEGDIYRLIIKAADQSKNEDIKVKAEIFEKWIFDEVIPSIRKTGSYLAKNKPNLNKLLEAVKTKREFFLLSGLPKSSAYSRALESVEQEYSVDLSEFKLTAISPPAVTNPDLNLILKAIKTAISNGAAYRDFGNQSYALNRDMVYAELDARGLSRIKSLGALNQAGILKRGKRHYTRKLWIDNKRRSVRAFFINFNK